LYEAQDMLTKRQRTNALFLLLKRIIFLFCAHSQELFLIFISMQENTVISKHNTNKISVKKGKDKQHGN
jgi:hypothetical protein